MKVTTSAHAFLDAIDYARASQRAGHGVVVSRRGDLYIVSHENGHKRGFQQESSMAAVNRLLSSIVWKGDK